MSGVTIIKLGFLCGFRKSRTHRVFHFKTTSRTSLKLVDILDIPNLSYIPEGGHDVWSQYHSTGFCLRFQEIYNKRVF